MVVYICIYHDVHPLHTHTQNNTMQFLYGSILRSFWKDTHKLVTLVTPGEDLNWGAKYGFFSPFCNVFSMYLQEEGVHGL